MVNREIRNGLIAVLLFLHMGWMAHSAEVQLNRIGEPIWRPTDFLMFSAPASTQADFFGVVDTLLPLEGPSAVPYVPHSPPYVMELTANSMGFDQKSVFSSQEITLQPNAVYLAQMFVPDPGVEGSSRDFGSGQVIPNSLFPITRNVDVWLDGKLVDSLLGVDGQFAVRGGDAAFDGASHRAYILNVFHPWDDDLTAGPIGNYEIRQSFLDATGNGWEVTAPFSVVPEPTGLPLLVGGLILLMSCRCRRQKAEWKSNHSYGCSSVPGHAIGTS